MSKVCDVCLVYIGTHLSHELIMKTMVILFVDITVCNFDFKIRGIEKSLGLK